MAQGTPSGGGRSFSADVLNRILTVLRQDGATKRTNLAGKTRLNYLTCIKYLELLKSLGLVQTTDDQDAGSELISINELGLRFNSNLQAYLQKSDSVDAQEFDSFDNAGKVEEFMQKGIAKSVTVDHQDSDGNGNDLSGKIMLVDDEKDILFTYQLMLSEAGYEAHVFSDPTEALRQIALSPTAYQLVITDIRMSTINGLQLYHGIRALNQNIKIMFISALDAADELVSVLPGLKKTFVLKKPVNKNVFTRTVEQVMQNGNTMLSTLG